MRAKILTAVCLVAIPLGGNAQAQEPVDPTLAAPGFTRVHKVGVTEFITTGSANAGSRLARTIPVPADPIVEALSRRDDDGPFVRVELAFDFRYRNFTQAQIDQYVTIVKVWVRKADGNRVRVYREREKLSFLGEATLDFGLDPEALGLEAGDTFELDLEPRRFVPDNDSRPLFLEISTEFRLLESRTGS